MLFLFATPMPVVNVGPPDAVAIGTLIFTFLATAAGILAAVYSILTFKVDTDKPRLSLGYGVWMTAWGEWDEADATRDDEISISVTNTGKSADGVYVDLWLVAEAPFPHLIVDLSQNPGWLQGDSETQFVNGALITWTRWTRYYRQHIPKGRTPVDLDPLRVRVPRSDRSHTIQWRLRSADGSTFPTDEPRGVIDYGVALPYTPPARDAEPHETG
jgi:hypothetical protein